MMIIIKQILDWIHCLMTRKKKVAALIFQNNNLMTKANEKYKTATVFYIIGLFFIPLFLIGFLPFFLIGNHFRNMGRDIESKAKQLQQKVREIYIRNNLEYELNS